MTCEYHRTIASFSLHFELQIVLERTVLLLQQICVA